MRSACTLGYLPKYIYKYMTKNTLSSYWIRIFCDKMKLCNKKLHFTATQTHEASSCDLSLFDFHKR